MPMAIEKQTAADFGLAPEQMAVLPKSVNADKMTPEEFHASLERSIAQYKTGKARELADVLADIRKRYML